MPNITGRLTLNSNFIEVASNLPASSNGIAPSAGPTINAGFGQGTSGVLADQVDSAAFVKLTMVAGTPQTVDLRALTGVFGEVVLLARVRELVLELFGVADGDTLTIGSATTVANEWVGLLSNPGTLTLQAAPTLANQVVFALTAPNTTGIVVSTTSHLLTLTASANMTVWLMVKGASV